MRQSTLGAIASWTRGRSASGIGTGAHRLASSAANFTADDDCSCLALGSRPPIQVTVLDD
jgi:hypothetical protein